MNDWMELHDQHKALRARGGEIAEIRRVLTTLSERKHIARTIQGRFTYERAGNRRDWAIRPPKDPTQERGSEPLLGLKQGIRTANLTLLARTDLSNTTLEKLTVMVAGQSARGTAFVIAAHLDEKHWGDGACSHPLFHCHVGPSLDDVPEVRVPLPALGPVAVLQWALSTVLPGWEPAPWNAVVEDARRRREQRS